MQTRMATRGLWPVMTFSPENREGSRHGRFTAALSSLPAAGQAIFPDKKLVLKTKHYTLRVPRQDGQILNE
jgi:hypothetical protein